MTFNQVEDYHARPNDRYAHVKYELLLKYLPNTPCKILNVGCGSGEFNVLLAKAGHTVDAIDSSQTAVDLAKVMANREGVRIRCKKARLEEVPGSRIYDVIVMSDVLEHIEDDRKAVAQVHNLLVAGGRYVLSVPAHQWLFGPHDVALHHFRRYSRRELLDVLRTKFEVRSVRAYGMLMIPIVFLYSKILRKDYGLNKKLSNSFVRSCSHALCAIEKAVSFPTGSSILAMAQKVL